MIRLNTSAPLFRGCQRSKTLRQDRGGIERHATHSKLQESTSMKLWHQIIRNIAATFIASRAAAEFMRQFGTRYP
jgi:hypothetical protein